jgi:competence protein ComEA
LAGLLIGAIAVSAGLFIVRQPPADPIVIHTPPVEDTGRNPGVVLLDQGPTPTPTPTATPTPVPSEIVVFVSGAVNAPGNYPLPPGARAGDALDAAGGFAPDAQTAAVNLAAPIHDGEQIHFPLKDEPTPTPTPTPKPTAPPVPVEDDTRGGGGVTLTGLINVNTATQAELESLPGIGEVKAKAIIDNRPYSIVDDLERVPGIGPATLANVRPYVTVE